MEHYFVYCFLGGVVIFLAQKSPYANLIGRRFLLELFSCDLCLGSWVYPILAWIMNINIFSFYVPIVSELLVGWSTAVMVHLIKIGWNEKFGTIVIE